MRPQAVNRALTGPKNLTEIEDPHEADSEEEEDEERAAEEKKAR